MLPSHSRANGVITGSPPYTVNGLPDEWVAVDTGVRFLSIKFRARAQFRPLNKIPVPHKPTISPLGLTFCCLIIDSPSMCRAGF